MQKDGCGGGRTAAARDFAVLSGAILGARSSPAPRSVPDGRFAVVPLTYNSLELSQIYVFYNWSLLHFIAI